jgi:hypothetical protein
VTVDLAKKRKLALPVPENDQGRQMWESLLAVAASAREANASTLEDESPARSRGQAIFDRLRKLLRA